MSATEALDAVLRYIDAFNQGDEATMQEAFDDDGAILDGMAPHVWRGPAAAVDWYRDVLTESAHLGASNYSVTLGDPLHDNETGDRAYIALPATMRFDLDGTSVTQTGAFFTVALRRSADDWRITAWAWTKGTQGR